MPSTQQNPMNPMEKHKISHSLHTHFLPSPFMSSSLLFCTIAKYNMLRSRLLNRFITSHIASIAAVTCAWSSLDNLGSLFTAYCQMGIDLPPTFLSWCANMFVSLFNILLQSGSRLCHSRKQLTYSSSLVSLTQLLHSLQGVAGWLGIVVPFSLG